jgi:hypothetical protein
MGKESGTHGPEHLRNLPADSNRRRFAVVQARGKRARALRRLSLVNCRIGLFVGRLF